MNDRYFPTRQKQADLQWLEPQSAIECDYQLQWGVAHADAASNRKYKHDISVNSWQIERWFKIDLVIGL